MRYTSIEDTLDERMRVAREVLRSQDPVGLLKQAETLNTFNINLLFGYVRSFVTLAFVGDVNSAAAQLNTTRQSIKRHIVELENLLELKLFDQIGRESRMSRFGALWLPRAQELLDVSSAFLRPKQAKGAFYQSTQLPLRMLLRDKSNSPLLREFANSWMQGQKTTSGNCFQAYKDYCILYERENGVWKSRHIGKKSAFSVWYGEEIARTSQGQRLANMETGDDIAGEILLLLDAVYVKGGLHFSEATCLFKTPNTDQRRPAFYQRLLAELVDDHDRPVVASVIEVRDPLQTDQVHD